MSKRKNTTPSGKPTGKQAKKITIKPNQAVYGRAGAHPQPKPVGDDIAALEAAAAPAPQVAEPKSPEKKFKVPKLSEKEIIELTQACRFAFGNAAADNEFDEIMAEAQRIRDRRLARDQQTRTE